MAENESTGGLSLEALLAAARGTGDAAPAPGAEAPAQGAAPAADGEAPAADVAAGSAPAEQAAGVAPEADQAAAAQPSAQPAASASAQQAAQTAPAASEGGFDLAAALGYGAGGSAPARREGSSYGSAVASSEPFDLAAALGYGSSEASGAPAGAQRSQAVTVDPIAIAEAAVREEQAQAAADVVAREAIARAAREEGLPRRSRYADLGRRPDAEKDATLAAEPAVEDAEASKAAASSQQSDAASTAEAAGRAPEKEQADQRHVHAQAVSRMAAASTQAAQAATAAQKAAAQKSAGPSTEEAPVTFKSPQGAKPSQAGDEPASAGASDKEAQPAVAAEALEEMLASQEPAFMSVQESEARAAQRAAEEAAAEEAARAAAEREAQEAAAREAAAKAAQQMAAQKAQAEAARAQAQAQAQAQAAAAAATAAMPPVRPRKAAVTATEEILVEPLPTQRIGTISYEDAVFADEARQMETAAERKASKKARRYRRLGTFLVIVAILAAAGAVALFLSGTANASEDIETKAVEISESAGRTITYRYRAIDSNGTLCPTTEVASFSTGGVLEQSVITMQTPDFETAAHTLAGFKKQFQDNAYVDGRVDNSSVVFTLHMSSEHLMKSTYTALVMSNTVGCEVII